MYVIHCTARSLLLLLMCIPVCLLQDAKPLGPLGPLGDAVALALSIM